MSVQLTFISLWSLSLLAAISLSKAWCLRYLLWRFLASLYVSSWAAAILSCNQSLNWKRIDNISYSLMVQLSVGTFCTKLTTNGSTYLPFLNLISSKYINHNIIDVIFFLFQIDKIRASRAQGEIIQIIEDSHGYA